MRPRVTYPPVAPSSSDGSIVVTTPDIKINPLWYTAPILNGWVDAAASSNNLVISLKNNSGNTPSASDPVKILIRNPSGNTLMYSTITVTGSKTLTIPSGSTFAIGNTTPFRLWVVGLYDSGVLRLGVVNCLHDVNNPHEILVLDDMDPSGLSTSDISGASASKTVYSDTVLSGANFAVLGYLEYDSGLATMGTFSSSPNRMMPYRWGDPLPGHVVQVMTAQNSSVNTGTTQIPFDDTIPQSTEGTNFFSLSYVPRSSKNTVVITAKLHVASTVAAHVTAALFMGSDANASAASSMVCATVNAMHQLTLNHCAFLGSMSSNTFNIRVGPNVAATVTFNGVSSARRFGAVGWSNITVHEIMG